MADGTDELQELEAELDSSGEFQDDEASAAMNEAQSVIQDAKSTAGSGIDLDDSTADADTTASTDAGSGSRLPSFSLPSPSLPSPSDLFSVPFFVLAVIGAVASGVGAGLIPLVSGLVAGGVGMLGAAFLLGLGSDDRHYLETALAGAAVLGALTFLGRLELVYATGGSALRLAGFGAGVGVVTAVVGTFLGRSLRGRILDALGAPEEAAGNEF